MKTNINAYSVNPTIAFLVAKDGIGFAGFGSLLPFSSSFFG